MERIGQGRLLPVAYAGFCYGGQPAPPKGRAADDGFGGMGQPAPSQPATASGERCKLPQRDPGQSPGRQAVLPIFKCTGYCNSLWVDTLLIRVTKVPAKHD